MEVDTFDAAMARPAGSYRIVRIQSRMVVGGPAWNVINLSAGLKSDYPTLVLTGGVEPGEADLTGVARARGVDVIAIPELGRAVSPTQDAATLFRLRALLRHLQPDIVHTHTAKAGAVGRVAAALAGVPVRLHTFHGHVFEGYFSRVATQGVISVERALARMSTRIVAISDRQAYDLGVRFRIAPPEKIVTIPLGLQLDRFIHVPRDARSIFRRDIEAGDRPVITIIGRLVPIKNHDLFLAAAAKMIAAGSRALFVIVGGGEEEARLKALADSLGISGQVRFLGYRADLEHIYAGTDIVALTSHNEGTPVAILEALAAGVHVVATDVGGVADVLSGLALATMVPAGDADALAAALSQVAPVPMEAQPNHPDAVAIRRQYGVQRLVDDMRALYGELAVAPPGGWRRSA